MPIEISCPRCRASLRFPDRFSGRRGMCSDCEELIRIPAVSESPAPPRPAPDADVPTAPLMRTQVFLRRAVRSGVLSKRRARRCEDFYRRICARGQVYDDIGGLLVDQGILTTAQVRYLSAADGPSSRPSGPSRECPNCFEQIPADKMSCPFCRARFDTKCLKMTCPSCGSPQDPGGGFCNSCGKTLDESAPQGGHRTCPSCRTLVPPGLERCPACVSRLDRSPATAVAARSGKRLIEKIWSLRGWALLLLVFVGLCWLVKNRRWLAEQVSSDFYGPAEATLRRQVDLFGQALVYGSLSQASRHTGISTESLQDAWKTGSLGYVPEEEELVSIVLDRIELRGSEAFAYVTIRVRALKAPAAPVSPIPEILGGRPAARDLRRCWTWIYDESGAWVLRPLAVDAPGS